MRLKTKLWFKALVAAIVGGISNAGLAGLGITGANVGGMTIPQLDPKQFAAICLSGGVVGLLLYLKQSPVPPDPTDTEFIHKPNNDEPKP